MEPALSDCCLPFDFSAAAEYSSIVATRTRQIGVFHYLTVLGSVIMAIGPKGFSYRAAFSSGPRQP